MSTGKMEQILYIDCFLGISGDMMAGALCDLGLDIDFLRNELKKMDITGYEIECKEIKVGSIITKKFSVNVEGSQPHRNFKDIKKILGDSSHDEEVKKISLDIFHLIAGAEAAVHDCEIGKIHFHEVGAVDSIIDIVSTAIGLKFLKIESFYCSKIPLGSGFVECSHGKLPVPAPAAFVILKEIPVYGGNFDSEVTTPTGAAIIKTLAVRFGESPDMKIEKIGYGAGSKASKKIPNILRLLIGTVTDKLEPLEENLIILSANIDDSTPEIMGYLQETLLK